MNSSSPVPLRIDAVVAASERPALEAAAEQLRECLSAAADNPWPVDLRFRDALTAIDAHDPPVIVIASLLPELARGSEPPAATEARWREQLSALKAMAITAILLCTVFRHVTDPAPDSRQLTRERIRRLNLLAIELSHDTGATVVDFDRVFAHLGARPLATDHTLTGRVAAEVAAHALVANILDAGLDDIVPAEVQARAHEFQGTLAYINKLVERRMAQHP